MTNNQEQVETFTHMETHFKFNWKWINYMKSHRLLLAWYWPLSSQSQSPLNVNDISVLLKYDMSKSNMNICTN